jgi:hypothetical protein
MLLPTEAVKSAYPKKAGFRTPAPGGRIDLVGVQEPSDDSYDIVAVSSQPHGLAAQSSR